MDDEDEVGRMEGAIVRGRSRIDSLIIGVIQSQVALALVGRSSQ